MLSVEFVGDGVLLRENGMEMTDESGVSGRVSEKIRSVRASENARDGDREENKGSSRGR